MRIANLVLNNFQCFGDSRTSIPLRNVTSFVGANGAGKSAALTALCRMFGDSFSERKIRPSDFHLDPEESLDDEEERKLYIEAVLEFPELEEDEEDASIPEFFRQMFLPDEGKLICRVRLEATYRPSNVADGDIEERLYWLTTLNDNPKDDEKIPLKPYQRDQIHVVYLPAGRDPEKEVRNVSGTLLNRLLKAAQWSSKPQKSVERSATTVEEVFQAESPVSVINERLSTTWKELYASKSLSEPQLKFAASTLEDLIRHVRLVFGQNEGDTEREIERLSDGWRSLLYFAIVVGLFDIERDVVQKELQGEETEFSVDHLKPPVLTVFAVEEPENHLSPHYLGRIMNLLRDAVSRHELQLLLTSHSASILSRVEPREVRHFRLEKGTARVEKIKLPSTAHDSYKFVNQAVKAFPELYFSRLVVLVEGDSERLVIPRLAQANGIELDPSFVSVVPLGGRHVNHFWRLLSQLKIPYLTLIDLDLGRETGGWARIKYICEQLLLLGVDRDKLLGVRRNGKTVALTEEEFAEMHTWTADTDLDGWIDFLMRYGVYFSQPLDFDMMMLTAFQEAYLSSAIAKPSIPKDSEAKKKFFAAARAAVLSSKDEVSTLDDTLVSWYRTLFLGVGKPVTHLSAMALLDNKDLAAGLPKVLKDLLTAAKKKCDED